MSKTVTVNVTIKEKDRIIKVEVPEGIPNSVLDEIVDTVKKQTHEYIDSGFSIEVKKSKNIGSDLDSIGLDITEACKLRKQFIDEAGGDNYEIDNYLPIYAVINSGKSPKKQSELLQDLGYNEAHANLIVQIASKILQSRGDDETTLTFGVLAVFFQAFLGISTDSVPKVLAMIAYQLTFDELIGFASLLDELLNKKYNFFKGFNDVSPSMFVKPAYAVKNGSFFYKKLREFSHDVYKKECENASEDTVRKED